MTLSRDITLERGIDLAREITQILNDIIREQGYISLDDQRIWSGWLHQRSNQDWQALLCVLDEMKDIMSPSQSRQIMASTQYFKQHKHRSRCMDRDGKKTPAWQAIMVTRELINQVDGVYIPNNMPMYRGKSPNQFHDLFTRT